LNDLHFSRVDDAATRALLVRGFGAGVQTYGSFESSFEAFAAHALETARARARSAAGAGAILERMALADLYLALACRVGDARALYAFDRLIRRRLSPAPAPALDSYDGGATLIAFCAIVGARAALGPMEAECPPLDLAAAAGEGRLVGAELHTFERHLEGCAACRQACAAAARTLADVASHRPQVSLPPWWPWLFVIAGAAAAIVVAGHFARR
jgi:hypothetical protein